MGSSTHDQAEHNEFEEAIINADFDKFKRMLESNKKYMHNPYQNNVSAISFTITQLNKNLHRGVEHKINTQKQMRDYLIDMNADLNHSVYDSRVFRLSHPILCAFGKYYDYESAEILIQKGADINTEIEVRHCSNVTIIGSIMKHTMCEKTYEETMMLLTFFLKHGAKFDINRPEPPLFSYCNAVFSPKNRKVIKFLAKNTPNNLNYVTPFGNNILMQSCRIANFEIFELLASLGANIHHVDSNGETLLCKVAFSATYMNEARAQIIQYLVQNGVNINQTNNEGRTVLDSYVASYYNNRNFHKDILELLLENGAKSAVNKCLVLRCIQSNQHAYNTSILDSIRLVYNYIGCEDIPGLIEYIKTLIENNGNIWEPLLKEVETWDKFTTLRTMCLRIVKTGQAGDDYKDFAPGYFEWFPGDVAVMEDD